MGHARDTRRPARVRNYVKIIEKPDTKENGEDNAQVSVRDTAQIRRQTKNGRLPRQKIKCKETTKCFQKPTVFNPQMT